MAVTDSDLINELRRRGYRVVKANRVRTFTGSVSASIAELGFSTGDPNIRPNIYRRVGHLLGGAMMEAGFIPVLEETSDEYRSGLRHFRGAVTALAVDPYFDWPIALRPGNH